MRILVIGPKHYRGSLTPYISDLVSHFQLMGNTVDWIGSSALPYSEEMGSFWSAEQAISEAESLLSDLDLESYGIISLHFGKLELEQYIAVLLDGKSHPCICYHVHSLSWDLFDKFLHRPDLASRVKLATHSLGAYVFFGNFAYEHFFASTKNHTLSEVILYPGSVCESKNTVNRTWWETDRAHASIMGFYSPWKDTQTLLRAFRRTKNPLEFNIVGPFWKQRLGFERATVGSVTVRITDAFVEGPDLHDLVRTSDFAIYPYKNFETFQGSGSLAVYLREGIPAVAFDVANLREQIGPAGRLVSPGSVEGLASAIDFLAGNPRHLDECKRNAHQRRWMFEPRIHAEKCLILYERIFAAARIS